MMYRNSKSGLTWVEAIVSVVIVGILVVLALPAFTGSFHGGRLTSSLSNMRQLHIATHAMVVDGVASEDSNLGWPGDTGGTFTNWARQLVPAYLITNDFRKLLSAPGKWVRPDEFPKSMQESAVLVYAVGKRSPTNVVLFSSANFTNSPVGGSRLLASAQPFGNRGFVVFRKGGDGAILLPKQVGQTNLIGAFAPLLK